MNFQSLYNSIIEKTAWKKHGVEFDDSVIGQLLPYVNDEEYYLHFSELNKLGNNPQSDYNTPQGIYLYPLKVYWDKYVYNQADFNIEIFKKYKDARTEDKPYLHFTDVIPFKADSKYIIVGSVTRSSGIYDFDKDVDDDRYYYMKERLLEFFQSISDYDVKKDFYLIVSFAESETTLKNNLGKLWNITRNLSDDYSIILRNNKNKSNSFFTMKPTVRWAYLLHKVLKISGFVDSQGIGIIHRNEPIQAVVFSTKDIKHVDTIINKEQYNFKTEISYSKSTKFDNILKNVKENPKLMKNLPEKTIIDLIVTGKMNLSKNITLNDNIILAVIKKDLWLIDDEIIQDYIKKHTDIVPKILELGKYNVLHIPNEALKTEVLVGLVESVPQLIPKLLSKFKFKLPFIVFKTAIDMINNNYVMNEVVTDIVDNANGEGEGIPIPDEYLNYLTDKLDYNQLTFLLRRMDRLSSNSLIYMLKNPKVKTNINPFIIFLNNDIIHTIRVSHKDRKIVSDVIKALKPTNDIIDKLN